MPALFFARRTEHIDLHAGPAVPDVGADFHPQQPHRGAGRPERHASLPPDLDLPARQVGALHGVGIRVHPACQRPVR